MLIHNFKYSFKTLFRNKTLIFWTFAFPIILATFFYLAFSNIENTEKLDTIKIAIVENNNFTDDIALKEAFDNLKNPESQKEVFNIKYTNLEEAKQLLLNDEITGYLFLEKDKNNIVVKGNGIYETIFKYIVEEIMQYKDMVTNIGGIQIENEYKQGNTNINYELIYNNILEKINNKNVNVVDTSKSNLSYTMIEFYTLIAMTCLYGGILGMVAINQNLPNMSSNGKRVGVSPISKGKLIFSSVMASYLTQIIGLALLFVYTIFVLNVDYGNNLLLIILLTLVGSLAGLTLGVMIGSVLKVNENIKTGILISFTMLGCFFSGMMGITMKYVIDTNIPWLNMLNPASMITDGFYILYYYETLERYFLNISSLLIFSFVMLVLSYISLRRQKYDNI